MSPRQDDQLTEVERIEQILRTGDWVRPKTSDALRSDDPSEVVRPAGRRPWLVGLVAAAVVGAAVGGGVGLGQVIGQGDRPASARPDQAAPAQSTSSADPPLGRQTARPGDVPRTGPGRLQVDRVRDLSIVRDRGNDRLGPAVGLTFVARISNDSSETSSTGDCPGSSVQVSGGPVISFDVKEIFPEAIIDCFNSISLRPGESANGARFGARVPVEQGPLLGRSVRWFLNDYPGAAVTFVMSEDTPLRVIGVLTIEELPTEGSDAFTLAYENLTDRPIEGFRCAPTVQDPPDGRSQPGEAYVDTSPAVRCASTTIAPGQQARERFELDLLPGTERVRVVGPEGSEIVVPLVKSR